MYELELTQKFAKLNMTHISRNQSAKTLRTNFSHEIDVWFVDLTTPAVWICKLGLWMGIIFFHNDINVMYFILLPVELYI